jgi:hypothetical protein
MSTLVLVFVFGGTIVLADHCVHTAIASARSYYRLRNVRREVDGHECPFTDCMVPAFRPSVQDVQDALVDAICHAGLALACAVTVAVVAHTLTSQG